MTDRNMTTKKIIAAELEKKIIATELEAMAVANQSAPEDFYGGQFWDYDMLALLRRAAAALREPQSGEPTANVETHLHAVPAPETRDKRQRINDLTDFFVCVFHYYDGNEPYEQTMSYQAMKSELEWPPATAIARYRSDARFRAHVQRAVYWLVHLDEQLPTSRDRTK